MSEKDLKNIRVNQDNSISLTQFVQRTEEYEMDYSKWTHSKQTVKVQDQFLRGGSEPPVKVKYMEEAEGGDSGQPQPQFTYTNRNALL